MRRFKTNNSKVNKIVEEWSKRNSKDAEIEEDVDKAVEALYKKTVNQQRIINTRSGGKISFNHFAHPISTEPEMMNTEKKDHGFQIAGFAETDKPNVKSFITDDVYKWSLENDSRSPFNSNNNKEMKNNFKIGDKVIMEAKMVNAIGFDCNNKDVEGFVMRTNSREISVFMVRLGTTATIRPDYWQYMKKTVKDKEEIESKDKQLLPSAILPLDERIDEDLLYSAKSFDDLGISPEIFIMTLIRYDKALKRAEEIIKKYALV